jgi:hypothetical protein
METEDKFRLRLCAYRIQLRLEIKDTDPLKTAEYASFMSNWIDEFLR